MPLAVWVLPPDGAPDGWPWRWPRPDPVTAAERQVRRRWRWWRWAPRRVLLWQTARILRRRARRERAGHPEAG